MLPLASWSERALRGPIGDLSGQDRTPSVFGFDAPRLVPSANLQGSADGAGGLKNEGSRGLKRANGVLGAENAG